MTSHALRDCPKEGVPSHSASRSRENKVLRYDRIGDRLEAVRLSDLSLLRCSLD
jgi:hypothetical protein